MKAETGASSCSPKSDALQAPLRELLTRTAARLRAAGVPSPETDAALLLGAVTGLNRTSLMLARRSATNAELAQLETLTRRREQREPLQHILRSSGFYGLELLSTPAALIPRPETERLVEIALQQLQRCAAPVVLDVGTGSGAIALALASERLDSIVYASDVSPEALALARDNAERLQLNVRFLLADLLDGDEIAALAARADLLVSNPPYLPDGDRVGLQREVEFDPALALFAGPDGLDVFRRLERQAFALLQSEAQLLVELDPRNVRQARQLAVHWQQATVLRDLTERERFLLLSR